MRVLLIVPEFHPFSIGGGGVVVKNLAQGLEKKDCSLAVISATYHVRGFLDCPHTTNSGKTEVTWLPLVPSPQVGFQLKSYLPPNMLSVFKLLKVFVRGDFDVVHLHGFGHVFCDFAGFLSKLSGKPYIHTIHGFPKEPQRRGGFLRCLYGAYTFFSGNPTVKSAAKIVAVSGSLAEECKINFPNRTIKVILNGIDSSCCLEPSVRKMQEVTAKFGLEGKKVILGLGRLREGKGFQYAIRALPYVLEKVRQAQLVIAGEDDGYGYTQELSRIVNENGVKNHVSFVGRVTDEDEKNALLWQASVIVIPSLEESFGLVALEAMGSGRPIVASRIGGLSEILAKDEYTRLVESGNVEELADALIATLTNSDLQVEAKANRVRRLGEFNMDRMAEAYFNLYVSLISESSRAGSG